MNAVGFVDDTSNILYSGSDSGVLKIWDRRSLNESNPKEVGVLIGHLDGITYIDSKNDTRYLISNSKDQTIKLWDMRVFSNKSDENLAPSFRRQIRYHSRWDYRWDEVPKECKLKENYLIFSRNQKANRKPFQNSLHGFYNITGRCKCYDVSWSSRLQNVDSCKVLAIGDHRAAIHLHWLWNWTSHK